MSLWHEVKPRIAVVALVLTLTFLALPALMSAQSAPAAQPAQPQTAQSDDTVPKEDLFVGYQWLNPGGNVPDQNGNRYKLPGIAPGGGVAFSYNFTSNAAFEADWGTSQNDHAAVSTGLFGPKFTLRQEGINFFGHGMVGIERMSTFGSHHQGLSALAGGGIDLKLWKPITLRLFEADYLWARQNFAEQVPLEDASLRRSEFNGVRLRTGVVFNLSTPPVVPVAAACSVQNPQVMVGEPVHVSVAASNFNPKHTLTYNWSASGGKIEGKDTAATIDTNGVAGGDYTATATVTDTKAKKNNSATCTANFHVTEPPKNPPQMSCSASQSSVQTGTPVTITCTCTSPDNVPVTVGGWNSTGGSLSGSGNSATLNTSGASPGRVTVSATCTDSRGLTSSSSTSVTVENPPPAPPQATKLNECEYPNEKKPWRVDNTCKAMLDDVASKLQQDPDAKLVVVGNADPAEAKKSRHKDLAGERAVDVKAYLSGGEAKQNIDPSRIECRTGTEGTKTTQQWIIPAGASFPNASSTTVVDETKVKPIPDHPKPVAKKAKKKAE